MDLRTPQDHRAHRPRAGRRRLELAVPRDAGSDIRILAAVTCPDDPITGAAGTDSQAAVLASRFVAMRDVDVSTAEQTIELILFAVGAAVLLGAGAAVAAAKWPRRNGRC